MTIDNHLISRLEHLARLELSEEERKKIQSDLNQILAMVDKLNELDTENVEPLIYVSEEKKELRPDLINHQVQRHEALKNAPETDNQYFKVPKVIQQNK